MKKLITFNQNLGRKLSKLKDLPLLFLRIILAVGFYGPAMMKLKNIDGIISWFADMGMPMPALNAYLATATENLGVLFLILGFSTRIISVPLIIVMIVAIKTVHLANGFESGNNGFEIPLYYILMLFTLFIYGPGKYSLDYLFNKRIK
ncbi:MAG: DoxX family protein [Lutibacter sp.]|uniref:HvfX family Cu-binding RiPP maturation protein n=1 Tax=Lutibacter sp. TaxID=1925666 RepID=UPI00299DE767|nr:DoxX family protein [Lutibacter sp.]MDX1828344.1 DoxX family protein [Lutibacter sp.]